MGWRLYLETLSIGELAKTDGSFPTVVSPYHGSFVRGNAYACTFTGTVSNDRTVTIAAYETTTTNVYGYGIKFGNDEPHNNLSPHIAVYIWKRLS